MRVRSVFRNIPRAIGLVLVAAVLPLVAATPALAQEECTDWEAVTDEAQDYVGDGSMYIQLEAHTCSDGQATQRYARAAVHQVAVPDEVDQMRVRVYRHNGCVGCEAHFDSGELPLPGVGATFHSDAVPITPGVEWGGILDVHQADAPNPSSVLKAVTRWKPAAGD